MPKKNQKIVDDIVKLKEKQSSLMNSINNIKLQEESQQKIFVKAKALANTAQAQLLKLKKEVGDLGEKSPHSCLK